MAKRLRAAGVKTCASLAALTAAELARRVPGLSEARIKNAGWLPQARRLSRAAKPGAPASAIGTGRQRYATFTLDLLLDEAGGPRRSRAVHVQTGDSETWAGWDLAGLLAFLSGHSGAAIPPLATVAQPAGSDSVASARMAGPRPISRRPSPVKSAAPPDNSVLDAPAPIALPAGTPPAAAVEDPAALIMPAIDPDKLVVDPGRPGRSAPAAPESTVQPASAPGRIAEAELAGRLCLRSLQAAAEPQAGPCRTFALEQHFIVRLQLELAGAAFPPGAARDYQAVVSARSLSQERHVYLSEARGRLICQRRCEVVVEGPALPRGLYRLSAAVWLGQSKLNPEPRAWPNATLAGGLLQIRPAR